MKTALLAVTALLAAAPAEAQNRCITTPEAEAMTLVALPDIIQQTGIVCATRLPATSLIRRTDSDFWRATSPPPIGRGPTPVPRSSNCPIR
ncbi:hypothetical protein MOP88_15350 [Sphingomonas sp. WKB10]|nr:hypothetical protein [Sphingomonas sp. WKB10]